MVAPRDLESAREFMNDLASRLATRVQLTTDGHKPYLEAVEGAFGADIDYAMLIKLYGEDKQGETRYSPATCVGARKQEISGKPDKDHISTSYVERQNLTMRMHMRRFTRLTNAFSKKLENHIAAISLHFHILELLLHSPNVAVHSGDGRWRDRSGLGCGRYRGLTRSGRS